MFKGTGTAVITPFTSKGAVDFEALEKIINMQVRDGVDYLVLMGTTGESVTLEKDEKAEIVSAVKKTVNGRIPLVVGIGGNNTKVVANTIRETDFEGIAGVLSVSPYYNKPNQEGIYNHYSEVAKASPVPVILYNVPGRTGSNISAETTLRLAREFDHITTIKEASGDFDQCMEIIRKKPTGFEVVSGEDAITLPLISIGMHGVISVASNILPGTFSQMVKAARENRYEEACALHYRMLPLIRLMFADGSPGGVKVLMHYAGLCENAVRPPLSTVNPEVEKALKKAWDEFNNQ